MSTAVRKPAPRLPKPVGRYWKGKAPKGAAEVEDSDADAEEVDQDEQVEDVPLGGEADEDDEDDIAAKPVKAQGLKSMNVQLKDVDISKDGKVIVAGRIESGRTELEESEEETDEEEEPEAKAKGAPEESEEESSEEESESEEEKPAKLAFRPMFVPKRGRATVQELEKQSELTEEAIKKREEEAEQRRQESRALVADSIKRELLEKEKEEETPDIDDADGLDPTAEFEAWRLRELGRIKRDQDAQMAREKEREEIERRRALPEEQRLKEDLEHAQKLRDEKAQPAKRKFLQKYWHKGAFHQDADVLKRHDFNEATESTVDVTLLPKVMQVRDFGKRSRTKYTHLVDQDTTAGNGGFGGSSLYKPGAKVGEPGGGCFVCGGPHMKKDCPQYEGPSGPGGTGSNNVNNFNGPRASRGWGKDRERDREQDREGTSKGGTRDREHERNRYRDDSHRASDWEPRRHGGSDDRYRYRDGDRDREADRRRGRDYGDDVRDGGQYKEGSRTGGRPRASSRSRSRSPYSRKRRVSPGRDRRRSRSRSLDRDDDRDRERDKKRRVY